MSENLNLDNERDSSNSTDDENNFDEDMDIINEEEQIQADDYEIDRENENENTTRKRSWVWSHFSFDNTLKKARCNLCKALITTSKGSTTGMSNHMKTKHKITKDGNEQNQNQRQLTLQESLQDFSKIIVSSIFYFNL